jgi:hypothetical protein
VAGVLVGVLVSAVTALSGCIQVASKEGAPEVDAGALGFEGDGGPGRPPTGEALPLPTCGDLPGTTGGPDGGWALVDGAVVAGGGAGEGAETAGRRPARLGEVVISELMVDPAGVADTQGEWIELHNPTGETFDLQGCVVDDGGGALRALADPFALAPGGFKAIARSASAGFPTTVTMAMSLGNTGDSVAVSCDGVEIDRVTYAPGFPLAAGRSMALDSGALDAMSNDAPGAWCLAAAPYGVDFGTPGKPNPSCFDADIDGGT